MTKHVHLIALPRDVAALSRSLRDADEQAAELLRKRTRRGQPCGSGKFVARLEALVGRVRRRRKPGPKSKAEPRNKNR